MVNQIKILIVEDNPVVLLANTTMIKMAGYDFDAAETSKKALELAFKNTYDLIFMDLGLDEEMTGYQVTEKIKEESNLNKTTPIIALTAHTEDEVREQCLEVGMVDVLRKPITVDIIKTVVQQYALSAKSA